VLFSVLLITFAIFFAAGPFIKHDSAAGWSIDRSPTAFQIISAWRTALWFGLGGLCAVLVVMAAFLLGASCLGREFDYGTLEFLLTLPRHRAYFVWVAWAVSIAELLLMITLAVLLAFWILATLGPGVYTWRFPAMILYLFVGGAVVFGLTQFMAVVLRNSVRGLSWSLGIFLLHLFMAFAINSWANVHFPSLVDLILESRWAADPTKPVVGLALGGWAILAAAFPILTRSVFVRFDV